MGRDDQAQVVGDIWTESGAVETFSESISRTGDVANFGYFQERFSACFADTYVVGQWAYSVDSGGDGELVYAFPGTGTDGQPLQYELRLTGSHSGPWPLQRGQVSGMETPVWELAASGKRAKRLGCNASGVFDKPTSFLLRARPLPVPLPYTEPFLSRPFVGDVPVSGFLDHDESDSGTMTWWGEEGAAREDFSAYVFWLPAGTPLLASADGRVLYAGLDGSYLCSDGTINETQNTVAIEHVAPNGQLILTHFRMLSRVDVNVGDAVTRGEQIGLSGGYECEAEPMMRFAVRSFNPGFFSAFANETGSFKGAFDPYGWAGPGAEPIDESLDRVDSYHLWLPGEAPALYREKYRTILQSSAALTITAFRFAGVDDDANPNNESVRIELTPSFATEGTFDLTGYRLEDDDGNVYTFPDGFQLQTSVPVRVFSGTGADTSTELYWGRPDPVWSNTGLERAHLLDPAGAAVDEFSTWQRQTDDPTRPAG